MSYTLNNLIPLTKKIEHLLEEKFAAEGTGLISKAESVKDLLSPSILRDIKTIGRARNTLAHEENGAIKDLDYQALFDSVMNNLNSIQVDSNFDKVKLNLKIYEEVKEKDDIVLLFIAWLIIQPLGGILFASLYWLFFSDGSYAYCAMWGAGVGFVIAFGQLFFDFDERKQHFKKLESGELEPEQEWTFYSNRFIYKSKEYETSQQYKYSTVIKCELPADSCVLKIVTTDCGVTEEHFINLYDTSGEDYKNVAKTIFGIIYKVIPDLDEKSKAA